MSTGESEGGELFNWDSLFTCMLLTTKLPTETPIQKAFSFRGILLSLTLVGRDASVKSPHDTFDLISEQNKQKFYCTVVSGVPLPGTGDRPGSLPSHNSRCHPWKESELGALQVRFRENILQSWKAWDLAQCCKNPLGLHFKSSRERGNSERRAVASGGLLFRV